MKYASTVGWGQGSAHGLRWRFQGAVKRASKPSGADLTKKTAPFSPRSSGRRVRRREERARLATLDRGEAEARARLVEGPGLAVERYETDCDAETDGDEERDDEQRARPSGLGRASELLHDLLILRH